MKPTYTSYIKVIYLFAFVFFSCSSDDTRQPIESCNSDPLGNGPRGSIFDKSDCKINSGGILIDSANAMECLDYSYRPSHQILVLNHINAAFNCDFGKITAKIEFNGNNILIYEYQSQSDAFCNCLLDIDFELRNINYGTYHIKIIGPYTDGKKSNQKPFECDIDLLKPYDGLNCVNRDVYPWDI